LVGLWWMVGEWRLKRPGEGGKDATKRHELGADGWAGVHVDLSRGRLAARPCTSLLR
jgi:hypothetical protein